MHLGRQVPDIQNSHGNSPPPLPYGPYPPNVPIVCIAFTVVNPLTPQIPVTHHQVVSYFGTNALLPCSPALAARRLRAVDGD
jgi:hypothetical protein